MDLMYHLSVRQNADHALCARLIGLVHPLDSPFEEGDIGYLQERERVVLGTVISPEAHAAGDLLPPVLLGEPDDDPTTAEERYGQDDGYRYSGYFLRRHGQVGEAIDLCLTREALTLWQTLAAESPRHVQAATSLHRTRAHLFQLGEQEIVTDLPLSSAMKERLLLTRYALLEGNDLQRKEALEQVHRFPPTVFPLSLLFPCLNDPSGEVRERVLDLLAWRREELPVERLLVIADRACVPVRVTVLRLLGRIGGTRVLLFLLAARFDRHALVRAAALQALVDLAGHALDADVLTALRTAARDDESALVRATAAHLIETLGGREMIDAAVHLLTEDERPV